MRTNNTPEVSWNIPQEWISLTVFTLSYVCPSIYSTCISRENSSLQLWRVLLIIDQALRHLRWPRYMSRLYNKPVTIYTFHSSPISALTGTHYTEEVWSTLVSGRFLLQVATVWERASTAVWCLLVRIPGNLILLQRLFRRKERYRSPDYQGSEHCVISRGRGGN